MRVVAKLSEYQKKIESIDNVILCVAEAERMIAGIGRSLVPDLVEKPAPKKRRRPDPRHKRRDR
ncbi:MAG: hypothetical protein AB1646_11225 [Thermodesulfobacteriota bacterium]